jgi:small multidrug resistance pump
MAKYLFLIGAIVLEVAGTMMLPLTNNFSKLLPTVALGIFYLGSFYLLTFAMKLIPLSVVYATWSGVGVFLVAVLSYFF